MSANKCWKSVVQPTQKKTINSMQQNSSQHDKLKTKMDVVMLKCYWRISKIKLSALVWWRWVHYQQGIIDKNCTIV